MAAAGFDAEDDVGGGALGACAVGARGKRAVEAVLKVRPSLSCKVHTLAQSDCRCSPQPSLVPSRPLPP